MFKKVILVLVGLIALCNASVSAYNFSADRKELSEKSKDRGYEPSRMKLAILFEARNQGKLKLKTNLLKLKGELSRELLEDFQVGDPVLVGRIMAENDWETRDVEADRDKISRIGGRMEAGFVLFVEIVGAEETLELEYRLYDVTGNKLVVFSSVHPMEKLSQVTRIDDARAISRSSSPSTNPSRNILGVLPLGRYNDKQNYAYSYFTHTGLLIPQSQSIEAALWLKNVTEVELFVRHFRYDIRYKAFQFGINSEGSTLNPHRYTRFYVKGGLINRQTFDVPFYLSIGAARTVYRIEDDPYIFVLGDEKETKDNEKKADVTFLLAANYYFESLGLYIGVSWENIYTTFQSRIALHDKVLLLLESQYTTISNEIEKDDYLAGLELTVQEEVSFGLFWQYETKQTVLNMKVGF